MAGNELNPLPEDYIARFEKNLERFKLKRQNPNEKSVIDDLRDGLDVLMSDMRDPPKLTVAVYGDTGSGKSSLLNAILDEPNLVPKAGMGEACTSVAIRIEENKDGDDFAAEIEFLTREEWARELEALRGDLNDTDTMEGSSHSATYEAALALMEAVYGDVDVTKLGEMLKENEVTAKLGSDPHSIRCKDAKSLQDEVWKYMDSSVQNEGVEQYWPIVKQISLRIPKSDLCKSGTVFMDFPGVGDSNAARNDVAKKYEQTCGLLMVVTTIDRAADNKTAKTIIGERKLREQKMGGRRTVLVCTKSDIVDVQEVISKRNIPEATEWTARLNELKVRERKLKEQQKSLAAETEPTPAQLMEHVSIYRQLKEVDDQRRKIGEEKTSRCAVERNDHVKDLLRSNEAEQEPIKVFCVSSRDYKKISGLDDDDEPSKFTTVEQTEIPKLRDDLKQAAEEMREMKRISIKSDFRTMVSGLLTYLTNSELGDGNLQVMERNLQTFDSQTREVIGRVDEDIEKLLQHRLSRLLDEGVKAAETNAPMACANWARPANKIDRSSGGLAHNTYKATVSRRGEYSSKNTGRSISMNTDLCDPLTCHIEEAWAETFRKQTWKIEILYRIRSEFSAIMAAHTEEVLKQVRGLDREVEALSNNINRLQKDADEKLHRLDHIWNLVHFRNWDIISKMPAIIMENMQPLYDICGEKTGPGSFQAIKKAMADGIESRKTSMFQDFKENVLASLKKMKGEVVSAVNDILLKICDDHKKQIEALWGGQRVADSFTDVGQCKRELEELLADIERLDGDKGTKRKLEDGDEGPCSDNKNIKKEV